MRAAPLVLLWLGIAALPFGRLALGHIGTTALRATDLLTALAYLTAIPALMRRPRPPVRPLDHFYLLGGYDDPLVSERDSLFVGAGIRWRDDDLKYLLGSIPRF